ncbi:hypothetical protein METHB2_10036 [Candidatus Methylobacter favarea]|uniref:Uncharacterized protein n=1 Tax=Candidatus Methylobacter favarea TaxID=2707345 RepID=A0A8S0Y8Q0_9GAMM|nr:hypothetical protein METHB2_10036 [Candidatus Methylobacter favarea]
MCLPLGQIELVGANAIVTLQVFSFKACLKLQGSEGKLKNSERNKSLSFPKYPNVILRQELIILELIK